MNALPALATAFILTLTRCGGVLMLMPGIGEAEVPVMIRAALAAALALFLLPVTLPLYPALTEPAMLPPLLLHEIILGLWLGMLARFAALALVIAWQWIALLIGLASVLNPDPSLGPQATALARLATLLVCLFGLATGLYALPLRALIGSFTVLPPAASLPVPALTGDLLGVVSDSLVLALRLAGPLVLASLLFHAAMGMLMRIVGRLQIFFISIPLQLLGGFLLLGFLTIAMIDLWAGALRQSWLGLPGIR